MSNFQHIGISGNCKKVYVGDAITFEDGVVIIEDADKSTVAVVKLADGESVTQEN